MSFHYAPIGTLHTCFSEKFGVPRQPLMVTAATGTLKLNPDPAYRAALQPLETFSHIWVIFAFHKATDRTWRPTIQPPRLGAFKTVGVFASRSPDRPNPIGMSAVKLDRIDYQAAGGIEIHLSGVDILDGTPVLDIKPYLPYADAIPAANAGWASDAIERYPVSFSAQSLKTLESTADKPERHPRLKQLIEQMLEWDPRPTSQRRTMPIRDPRANGLPYAFRVLNYDVHWEVRDSALHVVAIYDMDAGEGPPK